VSQVLAELGFDDFTLRLNDRRALTAVLDCAGVPSSLHAEALIAIDKLDKIGPEGVRNELEARGIDANATKACLDFFQGFTRDDPRVRSALDVLRAFVQTNAQGIEAVSVLDDIVRLADGTPAHGRIRIDPSLARGLSYYTGAIMEISVPDLAGSLGGGGRYDQLVGMFLGRHIPACGFSLGLERIIVVMTERQMFPAAAVNVPVEVLVSLWSDETRSEALALAAELRRAGLRVDVYPDADKVGKQFKYASGRNVPFVAILGDDERARGEVALKDLRTGEQKSVARAAAPEYLQERLRSNR